jgi:hypothetical protein
MGQKGVQGARRQGRPLIGEAEPVGEHVEACQRLQRDLEEAFGTETVVQPLIAGAVAAHRRELQAAAEIDAKGLLVPGLYGLVPNPAVAMEERARRSVGYFVLALRQATRSGKIGGPTKTDRLPRRPSLSAHARRHFDVAVTS